jgi:hypothetical protein
LYRRTLLYAADTSRTKLAYNEFAYYESNTKPNEGDASCILVKKVITLYTRGGGGVKNCSKKCHVLFECPLRTKNTLITNNLN